AHPGHLPLHRSPVLLARPPPGAAARFVITAVAMESLGPWVLINLRSPKRSHGRARELGRTPTGPTCGSAVANALPRRPKAGGYPVPWSAVMSATQIDFCIS